MLTKVALLLVFVISVCRADTTCYCMSYLISEDGLSSENKISSISYDFDDAKCDGDGVMKCKKFCKEMYEEMTDNGKLCQKMKENDSRVADWMCSELNRDVCNARVGVFAQHCDSDAIDTGFRFVETLCCKDGYSMYC